MDFKAKLEAFKKKKTTVKTNSNSKKSFNQDNNNNSKNVKRAITNSSSSSSSSSSSTKQYKTIITTPPKRETNSSGKPLVDFLILGTQKSGTMAAVKNMNKHPDVFVLKECHYFDLYWDMGVNWYRKQLFNTNNVNYNKNKTIIGEKTPELIYVDDCALRIKQICPNAKFLLFLRDPVKRAYSNWNMQVPGGSGVEELSFSEAIDRELNSLMGEKRVYGTALFHYIQRGFYLDQIERFLKVFPDKSRLHIVIAEHMRSKPKETYDKIFEHIGAKPFTFEAEDEHVGSYKSSMSEKTKEKLIKVFAPQNERLFKFLGYRISEWLSLDDIKKKE